jgi:hypothetical protein
MFKSDYGAAFHKGVETPPIPAELILKSDNLCWIQSGYSRKLAPDGSDLPRSRKNETG